MPPKYTGSTKNQETLPPSKITGSGGSKWMQHLAAVRKDNPTKSLKECMQMGKGSYKR